MDKWNGNRRKQADPLSEAATQSTPKPGDYSLGSLESRVAARVMLNEKETGKVVIKIGFVSKPGRTMAKPPYRVEHGPYATIEYYREASDTGSDQT